MHWLEKERKKNKIRPKVKYRWKIKRANKKKPNYQQQQQQSRQIKINLQSNRILKSRFKKKLQAKYTRIKKTNALKVLLRPFVCKLVGKKHVYAAFAHIFMPIMVKWFGWKNRKLEKIAGVRRIEWADYELHCNWLSE